MAKPQSSRGRQNERLTVASVEAQRQYKETQRRLAQLDAIFESTHALLALLDRDLNFVMVNSAYAESSGHSKGELIGRNHFALFPNAENQAIFERVRDTGEPYRAVEKPFEYADQPERGVTYWNWTLVPVKAEDGTVQELVFSLLDVTETVRARQRIEQLVDGGRLAHEAPDQIARRERAAGSLHRPQKGKLNRRKPERPKLGIAGLQHPLRDLREQNPDLIFFRKRYRPPYRRGIFRAISIFIIHMYDSFG